jgi:hypothetical protein
LPVAFVRGRKRPSTEGADLSPPARPGDFGIATPADRTFKMPYVTIEAVLPDGRDRLTIVNDTNFGSRGRNRGLPDYSDFVHVTVPELAAKVKRDDG